jgi:hypothetical protein
MYSHSCHMIYMKIVIENGNWVVQDEDGAFSAAACQIVSVTTWSLLQVNCFVDAKPALTLESLVVTGWPSYPKNQYAVFHLLALYGSHCKQRLFP